MGYNRFIIASYSKITVHGKDTLDIMQKLRSRLRKGDSLRNILDACLRENSHRRSCNLCYWQTRLARKRIIGK